MPNTLDQAAAVIAKFSGIGSGTALVRYPADLGAPPVEKWMLFQIKTARHVTRTGIVDAGSNFDATLKAVALYMPPDALNSSLNVQWAPDDYGTIAGAAVAAWVQTGKEGRPITSGVGTQRGVIDKLLNTITATAGAAAKTYIASTARAALDTTASRIAPAGSVNSEAVQAAVLGATVNPRTDLFFKGVDYRTHTLSFVLVPRNLKEAQSIDEILNIFQFYMLPSFGTETGIDNAFIGYPYEFEISMFTQYTGSTHHINTIDRSVLTACTINHASSARVAFTDERGGTEYYPTSTTLTLSFMEVRLQGRNRQTKIWRGKNQRWSQTDYPDPRGTQAAFQSTFGQAGGGTGTTP